MDYIVHGVPKSPTRLSDFHFHLVTKLSKLNFTFYHTAQLGSLHDGWRGLSPYQRWHRKTLGGRAWPQGCPQGRRSRLGTSPPWPWLGTGSWCWCNCPGRRGGPSMLPTHRTSLRWEPAGGQAVTRRSKAPLSLKLCQGVTGSPQVWGQKWEPQGSVGMSPCAAGNIPASQGPETCVRFSCPQ